MSVIETKSTQYTAGPWRIKRTTYPGQFAAEHEIRGPLNAADNSSVLIAEMSDICERDANARLIAAAPEMLEALNEFLAYSECQCDRTTVCAFCMGEAAIRKAEGFPDLGKKALERMAFCLYNVGRCPAVKGDDQHSQECELLWTRRSAKGSL